jgi:prepilin-type processing-associated H-X9-DG protein
VSGLLGWATEAAPEPPILLDSRESEPLVPYPHTLLAQWVTEAPGGDGGRVVYFLFADGSVRMEVWSR